MRLGSESLSRSISSRSSKESQNGKHTGKKLECVKNRKCKSKNRGEN